VLEFDWCGEFQAMIAIVAPPPPLPPTPQQPIPQSGPLLEELVEGVAPKIRFQKVRKPENMKDIQESPLFQS